MAFGCLTTCKSELSYRPRHALTVMWIICGQDKKYHLRLQIICGSKPYGHRLSMDANFWYRETSNLRLMSLLMRSIHASHYYVVILSYRWWCWSGRNRDGCQVVTKPWRQILHVWDESCTVQDQWHTRWQFFVERRRWVFEMFLNRLIEILLLVLYDTVIGCTITTTTVTVTTTLCLKKSALFLFLQ